MKRISHSLFRKSVPPSVIASRRRSNLLPGVDRHGRLAASRCRAHLAVACREPSVAGSAELAMMGDSRGTWESRSPAAWLAPPASPPRWFHCGTILEL